MKIAHLSDIHFGRIAQPGIVEHIVADVNANKPDLVAVSGDLTQRARTEQFEDAAAMIDGFEAPVIVVPGNHDVYAWWYPLARLFNPLSRYCRYITDDLLPTYEGDGMAVLGVSSATGRTIKGGHITTESRDRIRSFFGAQPPERFKVLVVHHHLTKIQALGPHDVAKEAKDTLAAAAETGVDLILCGHLHISHVHPFETVPGVHRVVIVSAGTATSTRGRRTNRRTNFYNLIRVTPDDFTIEERRYDPDDTSFVTDAQARFDRDYSPQNV